MVAGDVQYASKLDTLFFHLSFSELCNFLLIFLMRLRFSFGSKTTLTENLEIDQYVWAILNTLGSTQTEQVIIDSDANWKSVPAIGSVNIKVIPRCNKINSKKITPLIIFHSSCAQTVGGRQ